MVDSFSPRELAAWRGFLRAHARLVGEFGEHLEKQHGISMDGYAVLITLDEAGGTARMNALPPEISSNPGTFQRLVERLERDGYVSRATDLGRTGGFELTLTAAGTDLIDDARVTHRGDVRMRFLACATIEEQEVLGRVWDRMLAG